MRVCQICNSNGKRVILNDYDDQEMCLFECTRCGHRYIDALNLSQAYFDDYYLTRYTTDDKPFSDARLNALADCVASYAPEEVIDIGGKDMELVTRLKLRNIKRVIASGVSEDNTPIPASAVILSHTLEHIYDIGAMFERIDHALNDAGYLFIEVPIHLGYQDPKEYDYHWQHINKFRVGDLERLCTQKGFEIVESKQIADYREYMVWRLVGRRAIS